MDRSYVEQQRNMRFNYAIIRIVAICMMLNASVYKICNCSWPLHKSTIIDNFLIRIFFPGVVSNLIFVAFCVNFNNGTRKSVALISLQLSFQSVATVQPTILAFYIGL